MPTVLPASLLAAAGAFGDARVCLVVGAGCSKDPPTDLPLSRELSERAYERLVDDGVLNAGDCMSPGDLSALADAVYIKAPGSQAALVRRMEPERLRNAQANEGYLIAVALMLEGVVRTIVTLNFDLAINHALSTVGAGSRVSTLRRPEDWAHVAQRSVVYLHRNVECDDDDLVLRSDQLDAAWEGGWQEIVARAAVSTPICVFAGLGTPASVWTASTRHVKDAFVAGEVFLVGPGPHADSAFAISLEIEADRYIELGWTAFMRALAGRALVEHQHALGVSAAAIVGDNDEPFEDITGTTRRLLRAGLVAVGRARGWWVHQIQEYLPVADATANRQVADLLMGVSLIERTSESEVQLGPDDVVEFHQGRRMVGKAMLASGGGVLSGEAVAAKVLRRLATSLITGLPPSLVLLGSVTAPVGISAPPPDLIGDATESRDIVFGGPEPLFVTLQELRSDPEGTIIRWAAA